MAEEAKQRQARLDALEQQQRMASFEEQMRLKHVRSFCALFIYLFIFASYHLAMEN
jgi:hypothetical protein